MALSVAPSLTLSSPKEDHGLWVCILPSEVCTHKQHRVHSHVFQLYISAILFPFVTHLFVQYLRFFLTDS